MQGCFSERDRSAGLVAEPWAICGSGCKGGRGCGLLRALRRAQRRTHATERRGGGAGTANSREFSAGTGGHAVTQVELPVGWQWKSIGEVCRVIPGFAFKSKDWTDTGIPVIKIKNIQADCSVNTSICDCIPSEIFTEKLNKFVARKGDILIAMTGATAGKVGRLLANESFLINQRVAKLEPETIGKDFFWGVVSGRHYQELFFNLADGAAQPNMSGKQIEGVRIPVPPPQTQEKISVIIGSYDDLIENNTRRIEILEEMARRL